MNPSKIKPALIVLLKAYPNMTAERLCFMTGFPPDSVRRVLREDPCFVAAGPKTINGRVWTYNPDSAIGGNHAVRFPQIFATSDHGRMPSPATLNVPSRLLDMAKSSARTTSVSCTN